MVFCPLVCQADEDDLEFPTDGGELRLTNLASEELFSNISLSIFSGQATGCLLK